MRETLVLVLSSYFGATTIVGGMKRIVNNFPRGTRESGVVVIVE